MRTFFCTIALCLTIITLNAQNAAQKAKDLTNQQLKLKTPELDTVFLQATIQRDFDDIIKQLIEIEDLKNDLVARIQLIAKAHGIKPEELAGFTQDNKSLLKIKK